MPTAAAKPGSAVLRKLLRNSRVYLRGGLAVAGRRGRARDLFSRDAESRGVLYTRRCASPWSIIFDFDKRNNFYSDYVHMLGKVRVYSPEVMKVAAAWLRKAVRRMSKCLKEA